VPNNRRSLKVATTKTVDDVRSFVTGKPTASTVFLSVRVTPALRDKLRLASARRKVDGVAPWALQDIVAAALDDWCRRELK